MDPYTEEFSFWRRIAFLKTLRWINLAFSHSFIIKISNDCFIIQVIKATMIHVPILALNLNSNLSSCWSSPRKTISASRILTQFNLCFLVEIYIQRNWLTTSFVIRKVSILPRWKTTPGQNDKQHGPVSAWAPSSTIYTDDDVPEPGLLPVYIVTS